MLVVVAEILPVLLYWLAWQVSGTVEADFFLSSIVMDFMNVGHAFGNGFLNPFVHLVFILIEIITAKYITACKRRGSCSLCAFSYGLVICSLCVPPRRFPNIVWV